MKKSSILIEKVNRVTLELTIGKHLSVKQNSLNLYQLSDSKLQRPMLTLNTYFRRILT